MSQQTVTAAEIQRMGGLDKFIARGGRCAGRRPQPGRNYATEGMNKTEAAYAAHLESLRMAGEVLAWRFEPLKLKLADKAYYTPDFIVVRDDGGIELHEVKGFWEDDARVKIKVAAAMNPWFTLLAVQADGKGWKVEQFASAKSKQATTPIQEKIA